MQIKKLLLLGMFGMLGFGCSVPQGHLFPGVFADSYLNFEQFLSPYLNLVTKDLTLPQSYKDISLKYKNIDRSSSLYDVLQKAVYANIFPNAGIALPLDARVTQDQIFGVISSLHGIPSGHFDIHIDYEKGKFVTVEWLRNVLFAVQDALAQDAEKSSIINIQIGGEKSMDDSLLNTIYEKLHSNYIDAQNVTGKDILYGAIQGMVESLKDPYTVFFPPTDAKDFNEQLQGEYEGIGAYVEMLKPGILMITSPVSGSPADKVGILAGDRIIQIDDHKITEKTDVKTAINWIKGVASTSVILKILREGTTLTLTIVREKVVLKNVSAKIYTGNVCVMNINMFGYGVYNEFVDGLKNVFGKKGHTCDKYIFDVRNNPGGSLEEVSAMLDYFVPTGKPSVVVKSKLSEEVMTAEEPGIKLTDKNVVVLMNDQSASASEIFAGTLKDYLPHCVLMGKKSFGKGSVQELLQYPDGSMLKYTIAKWYTGKTQTSVDHNGLNPDVELADNVKTLADEQLNAALNYTFK